MAEGGARAGAVGSGHDDRVGDIGIEGVRRERRRRDGGDGPVTDPQVGGRLHPGPGHAVPAEGLERDHQLDRGGAEAVFVLRDEQRLDALVGQP